MAETAASTFFSKRGLVKAFDELYSAHERGNVVTCFATEFVLVAEPENVLYVRDEVVRVRLKDCVDEEWDESVGWLIGLGCSQKAKYDLAAVQHAYDLIPWRSVAFDLEQLLLCKVQELPAFVSDWLDVQMLLAHPLVDAHFLREDFISLHIFLMLAFAT
jgi:hypothetical protein